MLIARTALSLNPSLRATFIALPNLSALSTRAMSAPSRPPRKHFRRPKPSHNPSDPTRNNAPSAAPSIRPAPVTTASVPPSSPPGGTKRFSDFSGLSPELIRAIPHTSCTEVQAATIPIILEGHDILAQAKTGTGKTLAFLIPAIQNLINRPSNDKTISILVISPTRELAFQIAKEAEEVFKKLPGGLVVKAVVGGTNIKTDVRAMGSQRIDVLVATPGRVNDLLENTNLPSRLTSIRTLIFDEADRLLDQGFQRDIEKIMQKLPDPRANPRQTFLFSATFPEEVKKVARAVMRRDHKVVSTISEDDVQVHEHVRQELVIAGQDQLFLATYLAFQRGKKENPNAKVICFLPTARSAGLFYEVFKAMNEFPVWEIHSRMSQSARTKTTEQFRKATQGVLFSSDVTARGIDIKDITSVIQVGAPASDEQYIHRLGRTARAGAEGHGVLILSPFEQYFLKKKAIEQITLHKIPIGSSPEEMESVQRRIMAALNNVDSGTKAKAYGAWLGYYKSNLKSIGWDRQDLVDNANDYVMGALRYPGGQVPGLTAQLIGKMGLKGVKGLRIVPKDQN